MYEYYENYGHKIANAPALLSAELPEGKPSSAYKKASLIDPYAEKSVKSEAVNEDKAETPEEAEEYDVSLLSAEEAKVYNILKKAGKPVLADELAAECEMDISDMLMLLTDLELEGAVKSSAGQSYTI